MQEVTFVSSKLINQLGIRHGWFMRFGGVSEGLFSSLNGKKGSGDADANVVENRARAARALQLDPTKSAHIIHAFKTDILTATEAGEHSFFDASITTDPEVVLSQTTADCGNIILASEDKKVLAMVHGSWHTLKEQIICDVVAKMKTHTDSPIAAALGPMICAECYEFGPEAADLFEPHYLTPNGQKFLVNLKQMILDQLQKSGVHTIDDVVICTKEDERFFSHRRNGAHSGRMIALASLTDVV